MANQPRRIPVPSQQYYAVPQSPRQASYSRHHQSNTIPAPQPFPNSNRQRDETAHGVATGAIGGGYGPYSYNPSSASQPQRYGSRSSRFSAEPSEVSLGTTAEKTYGAVPVMINTSSVPPYMWDAKDPDLDDPLHNPDPVRDAALDRSFTLFSARGWANASALVIVLMGLITLFMGYPIIHALRDNNGGIAGFNLGGINATGQVANLTNFPSLIDAATDQSVYTRTGSDGHTYNLVFSDEFETDGRTFWPGDDPYWEAADLNYWPTGDLEWYDPQAITTQDGKLVITMDEISNHDLNFRSGMLTSWNKFCFTTGYIEVSISMPGSPRAPGLWPGAWTMANLGRAGYGATTEGMWPYSYDTCDLGTFPNQTYANNTPTAAATGGSGGSALSFLPGQRLSACTCPGSDHPGPSVSDGRGVPEIDIIETQIDTSQFQSQVSQSFQTAPYNYNYEFVNTTDAAPIFNSTITAFNSYKGGQYQQAISALTDINMTNYDGAGYGVFGYEWWSDPSNRDDGYITWYSDGSPSWTMNAAAIGPDTTVDISQRLVPEEPMYIILNLGMSPSFQAQDFKHMTFPSKMYFDYVRVYQRDDVESGTGCSPASHPTADYIANHINAYSNANLTTWAQANYTFPRNSKYDGC